VRAGCPRPGNPRPGESGPRFPIPGRIGNRGFPVSRPNRESGIPSPIPGQIGNRGNGIGDFRVRAARKRGRVPFGSSAVEIALRSRSNLGPCSDLGSRGEAGPVPRFRKLPRGTCGGLPGLHRAAKKGRWRVGQRALRLPPAPLAALSEPRGSSCRFSPLCRRGVRQLPGGLGFG
jgi:hypothetical protein